MSKQSSNAENDPSESSSSIPISDVQLDALKFRLAQWMFGAIAMVGALYAFLIWAVVTNIAREAGEKGATRRLVEKLVDDDDFHKEILARVSSLPTDAILLSAAPCENVTPGSWTTYQPANGRFLVGAGYGEDVNGEKKNFVYGEKDSVGEYLHKLKVNEIPPHTHPYTDLKMGNKGQGEGDGGSHGNVERKDYTRENKGGDAHNNIPPFLAVYVCKQIQQP